MFGWLKKLFSKQARLDFYTESEQAIYAYWNGEKIVKADPMALYRKLMGVWPELAADINLMNSEHSSSPMLRDMIPKAETAAVAKTRDVFGLVAWDGEKGLTEMKVMDVLYHFLLYTETLKKNTNGSATPATATSAISERSWPASPPTPNPSESGSTGSESSAVVRNLFDSGHPSPSEPSPPDSTIAEPTPTENPKPSA